MPNLRVFLVLALLAVTIWHGRLASAQCNPHWQTGFSAAGTGNPVYAISPLSDGRFAVGGAFQAAGTVRANGIALYDAANRKWSPLRTGVARLDGPGTVYSLLELPGGDLIAGGDFAVAGGLPAANIAMYRADTHSWAALGTGTSSRVLSLVLLPSGDVLAGGFGGLSRWHPETAQWFPPASLPNGAVRAMLTLPDGRVVMGGGFTQAGTVAVSRVALYDPVADTWTPIGSGVSEQVFSLALDAHGNLLAGGTIVHRCDLATNTWTTVPSLNGYQIAAMLPLPNDNLLVGAFGGGGLQRLNPATGVVTFLSSSDINALRAISDTEVFVGGAFVELTSGASGIANFHSSTQTFSSLCEGTNGSIYSITPLASGGVLLGGTFTQIFGAYAKRVSLYSPASRSCTPLGDGVNGPVYTSVQISAGDVIVGGDFSAAGSTPAANIARYNFASQTWTALTAGTTHVVTSLALLPNDVLLVGTNFGELRRFSLATGGWVQQSAQTPSIGACTCLLPLPNGDVLVGYGYSNRGISPSGGMARYRPSTNALSVLSPNNLVQSLLAIPGGDVIVGGAFTNVGSRIARYNPTANTWTPLGSGFSGSGLPPLYSQTATNVQALALLPDGDVIAAGGFGNTGNVTVNNIARYDFASATWSSLGAGINIPPWAAATAANGDLLVGGYFETAGNLASWGFAVYSTRRACPADFNCSNTLEPQDIFDFLGAWFASNPDADFNGGGISVQDIFDYLAAWFVGC